MPAIGQGNLRFHRVYRAMCTVRDMMMDRGYLVADVIPESYRDFMDRYVDKQSEIILRDRMNIACERKLDAPLPGAGVPAAVQDWTAGRQPEELNEELIERAAVVFLDPENFTTNLLLSLIDTAKQDGEWKCKTLICVLATKPNLIVRRAAETVNRSGEIHVEIFEEEDLAVNITHHELVPKHSPLSEKDLREVLQAYAIQKHQLPRLLTSDPVAAYFGLKRGQVVKIERKSASAGVYVTYRQVV